ncbi:MAG: TPM domain-containing protein [Flavobacteriales bacterium]
MRYALALTSALLCLCFIPKKDKHRETFIYDHEQALDPAEEMRLDTLFRGHEARTTNEIVLVTTHDYHGAPDLMTFAATCGDSLRVGKKGKNNGVIIAFSRNLREVYIATGLGTERVFAEARARKYIDSLMLPLFKEEMFFDGLWSGCTALVHHLELPENRIE